MDKPWTNRGKYVQKSGRRNACLIGSDASKSVGLQQLSKKPDFRSVPTCRASMHAYTAGRTPGDVEK